MFIVPYIGLLLLFSGIGACISFVQHGPAHGCDYDATGKLDDGQGDAEEFEDGGTEQFYDCEENYVIDCDSARQRAIHLWGRIGGQPEKDQGRPEWIDQRKKHAERDQK